MEEKARLIQQLDEARELMRAAVADVDPNDKVNPEWTVKDMLAHIVSWEDPTTASLRAHASGEEPPTPALGDIDVFNAEGVAAREALNYEQMVEQWEYSRDRLKDAIDALPEEKTDAPLVFPWGPRGGVERLVSIMAEHEAEHAAEIRALAGG